MEKDGKAETLKEYAGMQGIKTEWNWIKNKTLWDDQGTFIEVCKRIEKIEEIILSKED